MYYAKYVSVCGKRDEPPLYGSKSPLRVSI